MYSSKKYREIPEVVLGNIEEISVPEVRLSFIRTTDKKFLGKISSSEDAAFFLRKIFLLDEIELQEQFVVLYLDRENKIIGYYKHSRGGISGTVVDVRLILSVALKCNAVSIMICHNHPSGNTRASQEDVAMTKKIKEAAKIMDITLLDHIIITKDFHTSFQDEGLLGISQKVKLYRIHNSLKTQIMAARKKTKTKAKPKSVKKRKRSNCRPTFHISEAGHLLATKHDSDAGRILSTEAKKQKAKRKKNGCLNGTGNTFYLTEAQKRKLPKALQKAILEYQRRKGKTIIP